MANNIQWLKVTYVLFVLVVLFIQWLKPDFQMFMASLVMGSLAFIGALVVDIHKRTRCECQSQVSVRQSGEKAG